MDKSPDAFRTISEVAEDLDLPQHVLRFWETRFAQIKPMKRGGGRRYYRPQDVELIKGIRHMLYDQGYTLFHQGRFIDAESAFRRFLQEHPDNDHADNAQYWIGEARYARDDARGALAAFRETVDRYPHGNKVPDALLKAGQCLEKLGDREGARATYREVTRRFPESAASAAAEDRLAGL